MHLHSSISEGETCLSILLDFSCSHSCHGRHRPVKNMWTIEFSFDCGVNDLANDSVVCWTCVSEQSKTAAQWVLFLSRSSPYVLFRQQFPWPFSLLSKLRKLPLVSMPSLEDFVWLLTIGKCIKPCLNSICLLVMIAKLSCNTFHRKD